MHGVFVGTWKQEKCEKDSVMQFLDIITLCWLSMNGVFVKTRGRRKESVRKDIFCNFYEPLCLKVSIEREEMTLNGC